MKKQIRLLVEVSKRQCYVTEDPEIVAVDQKDYVRKSINQINQDNSNKSWKCSKA